MFGYIKPLQAELRVKEYELYRAVYCGLCAALGRNTSCISRLSLSYDFVFLAVVRMALTGETGKIERRRCIAHPTKKRAVLTDAPQLDYCARISSVLTYYKLLDDISDTKGIKKLGAYLLLPAASHMKKRAKFKKEAEEYISSRLWEMSRLEKEGCDSLDRMAEPFGELMAYITASGFSEGSAEYRIASEIGRHTGRFIYIADALDDLDEDIKSGSYNPFAMMFRDDPKAKMAGEAERINTALTMELMGISQAVELTSFDTVPEYGEIVKNIIYLALPALAERLINKNTADDNGELKHDRPV